MGIDRIDLSAVTNSQEPSILEANPMLNDVDLQKMQKFSTTAVVVGSVAVANFLPHTSRCLFGVCPSLKFESLKGELVDP